MQRGDVYWARLGPAQGSEQAGGRPVIVVSRNAIHQNSAVVIVVPVTNRASKRRIYPSQIELEAGEGGLAKDSVAMGEQVRAIAKHRLGQPLGHLSPRRLAELSAALKIALDLP